MTRFISQPISAEDSETPHIKERAIAHTTTTGTKPGRYRPHSSPSSKPSDYADIAGPTRPTWEGGF